MSEPVKQLTDGELEQLVERACRLVLHMHALTKRMDELAPSTGEQSTDRADRIRRLQTTVTFVQQRLPLVIARAMQPR